MKPLKEAQKTKMELKVSTIFLDQYAEWDKKEKEAKTAKDLLKPQVKKYLRDQGHEGFRYTVSKKSSKIDPFKIYQWLTTLDIPPDLLDSLCTKSMEDRGLDELFIQEYIKVEDIPADYYEFTGGTETITVIKPKE